MPASKRGRIRRGRDARQKFMRFRALDDAKVGDDGMLELVASTDAEVRMGSWRESLSHEDGAVDFTGAHSLLINHNGQMIAGAIRGKELRDGKLYMRVEIMKDARLASGPTVRDAVNFGALRGVSIGYDYDADNDADWNDRERTVRVRRWRFLEVTLTPTPADADAGVRSCPFDDEGFTRSHGTNQKEAIMEFEQWLAARGIDATKLSDADKKRAKTIFEAGGELPANFAPSARTAVADEAARANELAKERAARQKAERELTLQRAAASHGVDTKDMDLAAFESVEAGLNALLARKAKASVQEPIQPLVKVTEDGGDKLFRHIDGSLHRFARLEKRAADDKVEMPKVAMGGKTMLRAIARAAGHGDVDYWSDAELGMWAVSAGAFDIRSMGRGHQRDAANKIVANFSNILANVAFKTIEQGLGEYNASTWQEWCTIRNVPNFLQVSNVGLASGRLTLTPENEAFPELNQKDGGYNSTLGLYGATISLSWQTLVNDMLGRFMDSLRRVGSMAGLTMDRAAYSALLNATWTNDLSSSSALSTKENLDKPRAALKNKLSPAGEKMGVIARYLLHDTANARAAQEATGRIFAYGQTTAPSIGSGMIVPIESHWIGDTNLFGSALTTDYYVTGDPNLVDTVLMNFLEGVGMAPVILPYDPGAVAAEKWKIMVPFAATMATHTDSAGDARNTGLQKAQA